ncbi:hypothetical protein UABAM_04736 [Candidatus Uabimicrobium amorphum]|uniref:Uncharacterized protein n=1 Tax=Uabimicrobium amorphum TaxID=2596890 RepID=A0A5S9IRR6_UABAM|nr:hypothetical protein UABAM_04736 [Candidatus Uabimicrobium amorphum]
MGIFKVTFKLESEYENELLNQSALIERDVDADDLDMVYQILDEGDYTEHIDDSVVIDIDSEEKPIVVNIEYVKIVDSSGTVVYEE